MKWLAVLAIMLTTYGAFGQAARPNASPSSKWKEECGSCHLAYPARFLSAGSWQRLMNDLDRHFGENAELDAQDNKIISDYLKRNAGGQDQQVNGSLRISDSRWFRHEHNEVPSRMWSNPSVKSPANCAACHVNAAQGDWSEDGVRMPDGRRSESKSSENRGDDDEDEDGKDHGNDNHD